MYNCIYIYTHVHHYHVHFCYFIFQNYLTECLLIEGHLTLQELEQLEGKKFRVEDGKFKAVVVNQGKRSSSPS